MGWERSTLRITGRDTAQTERILMRLVDTSSLDSRLHHSRKRVFARHPCFDPVLSCCVCQCCTHDSSFLLSPFFAHGSGAPGCSVLTHGSALCRQLKSAAYHPCIESVTSLCCLGPCCTRNSRGTLGSHFAHGSGAGGYSTLIHGSTS